MNCFLDLKKVVIFSSKIYKGVIHIGTYVRLSILPYKIPQEEWKKVYYESLQLLNAYSFADVRDRTFCGTNVKAYVKSQEIREEAANHWNTCGDLESKKYGETFRLYNDIKMYQKSVPSLEDSNSCDILFNDQHIVYVFDNKTQGFPYHLYILAIAMLIESRFPKFVLVEGNIDEKQCLKAKQWADKYLSSPINLPVRVNRKALLSRLKDNSGELERVNFLEKWLIDDPENFFELIYKQFSKETFRQWFISKLNSYGSPSQIGAIKLLIYYLNNVKDLDTLLYTACKDTDGPKFSEEEMIKALAKTWVCLPRGEFSFLSVFNKVEGHPTIIEREFGMVVMDLKFSGREINTYIPLNELSDQIARHFSISRASVESILKKENSNITKQLKEFNKLIGPVLTLSQNNSEEKMFLDDEDALLYFNADTILLTDDQEFLLESLAFSIHSFLKEYHELKEKVFGSLDKMKLILAKMVFEKSHLILTEEAWRWIDECDNKDIITTLLAKLLVDDFFEAKFKNNPSLLKGMFENKMLTVKITEYRNDSNVIQSMNEMLRNDL